MKIVKGGKIACSGNFHRRKFSLDSKSKIELCCLHRVIFIKTSKCFYAFGILVYVRPTVHWQETFPV